MFFWRMITRALSRQMSKRLMIAVTILLGSSLTTSMLAVMLDVSDKIQAELGSFGANIQILPQGASIVSDMYDVGSSAGGGSLREDELPSLKTIFWANNIEDFAPFLDASADSDGTEVPIVGTWFDQNLTTPAGEEITAGLDGLRDWWQITGEWADSSGTQAMAGARLANQHGWSVGDQVDLETANGQKQVTIAGIFQSGADEDNNLFVPLAVAQSLAGRSGEVGRVEVRAITTPSNELAERAARDPSTLSVTEWETWYCTAYVSSIAYQIEEVMTNAAAKPVRQVADTEGVILGKTKLIMSVVALFAMVAAALGIANLVTASVMERSKEMGLMKALGARNKAIVATLLTETFIVALIGGAIGFGLGAGLAQLVGHLVFNSSITIRPAVAPLMALVILVTVVLGSLPSMRYLLKLQPAQVLHGR